MEMKVLSLGQEDPRDKGMSTHSNILAWRSPWTEEPGEQQSMTLQRIRQDGQLIHTHMSFSHYFNIIKNISNLFIHL